MSIIAVNRYLPENSVPKRPSLLAETASWFKTGEGLKNLALKPIEYTLKIIQESGVESPVATSMLRDVKTAKLFLAGPEFIGSVYKFSSAIGEGDVPEAVYNVISAMDPATDLVMLADRYGEFLTDAVAENLKLASSTALLTGQTWGAVKNISKLVEAGTALGEAKDAKEVDLEKARIVHESLGLAKKAALIALAALTLVGIIFAITFSPWIGLALSVTALVMTIAGFFADKSLHWTDRKPMNSPPHLPAIEFFKGAEWAKIVVGTDEKAKEGALEAALTRVYGEAENRVEQDAFRAQVLALAANKDLQKALGKNEAATKAVLDAVLAKDDLKRVSVDFFEGIVWADVIVGTEEKAKAGSLEACLRTAYKKAETAADKAEFRAAALALDADGDVQAALGIGSGQEAAKKTAAEAILKPIVDKICPEPKKK